MKQKTRNFKELPIKSSKIWKILGFVIGLIMILVTIPLRWLNNEIIIKNWKIIVRSGREVADEIISLPLIYIFIGMIVFLIILIWKNRTLNQAWLNLKQDKNYLIKFSIILFIFLLTIIPYSLDEESLIIDPRYLTYLIIGSFGILLLCYGLKNSVNWFSKLISSISNFLLNVDKRYFLLICGGFVLLLTNIFSIVCFQQKPHIADTIAQLFHARIFAQGKLYLSAPLFPEFFDSQHIITSNGQWYSQYPPGHSAILALGVLTNTPWLINPLLGALAVIVFYFLGKELYDERTGRIAAILGMLSPFLLFMSSEFMSHASALLFLSCFILFFFRMIRKQSFTSAIIAGCFLGLAINIRPLTAFAIALPLIGYSFYLIIRNFSSFFSRLSVMTITILFFIGILLYYNYLTNGAPFTFGYTVLWGPDHGLGFGQSGWGTTHTPLRGLFTSLIDISALNRFLYEWSIPSLAFIALLFTAGKSESKDKLLLLIVITPVIIYFFYWFHRILFGPRWEYETLGALVILTARGIQKFPQFIQNQLKIEAKRERILNGLKILLVLCFLSSFIIALPTLISFYRRAFGTTRKPIIEKARNSGINNAVVVTPSYIYASSFGGNQLNLKGNIVYARDLSMLNPLLRIMYPERKFYYATGDSFYEIQVPSFNQSPIYHTLREQSEYTQQLIGVNYQTIFWPVSSGWTEFYSFFTDTTVKFVSLRQFYNEIYTETNTLDNYLPALVFWIFDDRQQHLEIFHYMKYEQNYIAANYRFTLLYLTENNLGAVYIIDRANGEETIIK
jgi:hypothetical protein